MYRFIDILMDLLMDGLIYLDMGGFIDDWMDILGMD